jgi:hypothetical protein
VLKVQGSKKYNVSKDSCRVNPKKTCFRNGDCERIRSDGTVVLCPILFRAKFMERKYKGFVGANPAVLTPSKFVRRGC